MINYIITTRFEYYMEKISTIGFIILRYVCNPSTDLYWKECYDSIRNLYPTEPILIVDDNSSTEYLTEKQLENATIVSSEFPKRGELLLYLYYLKYPIADVVLMLHDSMFITKRIDFSTTTTYSPLWDFDHRWDQPTDEMRMIQLYNDPVLTRFYGVKQLWNGCFGGMTIIRHDFLTYVNTQYDLSKLCNLVVNRYNRQSFERVIGCILQLSQYKKHKLSEVDSENAQKTMFGDIHMYCTWECVRFGNRHQYTHLPIIKVWTGR
jgi:hypothetical protein